MAKKRPKRAGPPAIKLILPKGFRAEAVLPPGLEGYAPELEFTLHIVLAANRDGTEIDYDRLDAAVGGPEVRQAMLDVLEQDGWIESSTKNSLRIPQTEMNDGGYFAALADFVASGEECFQFAYLQPADVDLKGVLPDYLKDSFDDARLIMHFICCNRETGKLDWPVIDDFAGGFVTREMVMQAFQSAGLLDYQPPPPTDEQYDYAIQELEKICGEVPELNGSRRV